MEPTLQKDKMKACSYAKRFMESKMTTYQEYVSACLNNTDIVSAANDILPFDNVVKARLHFVSDNSGIKNMGIALMRMDLESDLYSLGVSIEFAETAISEAIDRTEFIVACMTLEQIKTYVSTSDFLNAAVTSFEDAIDKSYYKNTNKD